MSNKAKVTVVIPNYNGLKFMDPCFKALNLQLCRDFDILVVDNGSTDGSVEWLKEHGCKCGDQSLKDPLCDPFKQ